ncbi:hypothetical protein HN51_070179 [Arachis hypogaea]
MILKRFRLLKKEFKEMVISEKWSSYKEDNVSKAESTDMDVPTLYLVHEMCDSMIKNVKSIIYLYEKKKEQESSSFYNVGHSILLPMVKKRPYTSIVNPKFWWLIHGGKEKLLQPIALRLLGQLSSSSCCERSRSIYSFIYFLKRNKLKPKRTKNLVFVHTNFRFLSKKISQYNE